MLTLLSYHFITNLFHSVKNTTLLVGFKPETTSTEAPHNFVDKSSTIATVADYFLESFRFVWDPKKGFSIFRIARFYYYYYYLFEIIIVKMWNIN